MKNRIGYLIFIFVFFSLTAFIVLKYTKKKEAPVYTFMERKGKMAQLPEWPQIKNKGNQLVRLVNQNKADINNRIKLVSLYLQEARISGNYAYYNAAALKYTNEVLDQDPNHFEALVLKSMTELSQHHFIEGLQIAEKARKVNPYNAFVHGLLVDGHVELGQYDSAILCSDQMISIRPDLRSYSRISYLREIFGDYPGAIEAMKLAIDAGAYGDEPTSWCRVQLGKLYEITGDTNAAKMHYTITLDERPGYSAALAGLAHVAAVNQNYSAAETLYQEAANESGDYAAKEQLVELYLSKGEKEKAAALLKTLIEEYTAAAGGEGGASHHADKELAQLYLLNDQPGLALKHAEAEYRVRPQNIDVNELLAWAYYQNNEASKAISYIDKALRTNSKNPTLLARAGLIYFKAGNRDKAKTFLSMAADNSFITDRKLKEDVAQALRNL